MNDDKLRDLIQSDHSVPDAPFNEWAQIKSKIEPRESLSFKKWAIAFGSVVILILLRQQISDFKQTQNVDDTVAEYLLDDNYFSENEDVLYAWVD